LADGDGYVGAGVVGDRKPDADGRCSGRFALLELGSDGAARAAVVASGLEADRWCAYEVETLVPDGEGGWLIGGVGRSEPEPSIEDQGPRGERLTLRISADGEPRDDFGDGGILHKTVVIGRVHDGSPTSSNGSPTAARFTPISSSIAARRLRLGAMRSRSRRAPWSR